MHPFLKRLFRLGKLRTALVLLAVALSLSNLPAQAQSNTPRRISPNETSAQIYQQYPDFPLENQYVSSETGTADVNNTFVSRLIRYHIYLKRRDPRLRLSWKLTMADYLGAFDRVRAERYLDNGLTENPLAGDVAVIESLSMEARDRLVNALYEAFTNTSTTNSEPASSESMPPEPLQ